MKFKWLFALLAVSAFALGLSWQQINKTDFETLSGEQYRWRDLHGQWVVVNYFAQWCAPCLREVPELNKFADIAGKSGDLALFAVDFDQLSHQKLEDIKHQYQMQFTLIKAGAKNLPFEKPQQLPATFIITPEGKMIKRLLGEQSSDGLLEQIRLLQRL